MPKNNKVSEIMSNIKARSTKPAIHLRKALWQNGLKGYRIHRKDLPGRPDIAYVGKKLAIFVHGCFWHRCPHCKLSLPKNNREFWVQKFEKNQERDRRKELALLSQDWFVLTFWECRIKSDIQTIIQEVKSIHDKSS